VAAHVLDQLLVFAAEPSGRKVEEFGLRRAGFGKFQLALDTTQASEHNLCLTFVRHG